MNPIKREGVFSGAALSAAILVIIQLLRAYGHQITPEQQEAWVAIVNSPSSTSPPCSSAGSTPAPTSTPAPRWPSSPASRTSGCRRVRRVTSVSGRRGVGGWPLARIGAGERAKESAATLPAGDHADRAALALTAIVGGGPGLAAERLPDMPGIGPRPAEAVRTGSVALGVRHTLVLAGAERARLLVLALAFPGVGFGPAPRGGARAQPGRRERPERAAPRGIATQRVRYGSKSIRVHDSSSRAGR
jgi:hypothetical protein